jgi:DNA-binding IclR family transcriptional regulator
MLLELLEAEIQDRTTSLSRIRKVSAVPASTADRWLNALERQTLVVRSADPMRPNDDFICLSRKGSSTLRRYFHQVVQSRGEPQ